LVGQLASNGVAVEAGFMPGDEFVSISGEKTPTWGSVVQRIATTVMAGEDLSIRVQGEEGFARDLVVNAAVFGELDENTDVLKTLGIEPAKPQIPAIVGEVIPNGPAEQAGLQQGDLIKAIDAQPVEDWFAWVKLVRDNAGQQLKVDVERNGSLLSLSLMPERVERGGEVFGRVGIKAQAPSEDLSRYRAEIFLGPVDAFVGAVNRTAEYSWLTLKVLGRMLIGEASVKNLSGPLTIADVAGQTASFGLVAFFEVFSHC
jgi:regulator of sigma E protease